MNCNVQIRMQIQDSLNQLLATPDAVICSSPVLLSTDSSTSQTPFLGCFNTVTEPKINHQKKPNSFGLGLDAETVQLDCGKSCCSINYCRTKVIPVPLFPLGNSLTAGIQEKMPIPTRKCSSKYILELQDHHKPNIMCVFQYCFQINQTKMFKNYQQ